jgi:branched-chain amino acid transport system permease protein
MNGTFIFIQALNGISLGMLLFLLASGIALITGLMGIVNLAQGSYFLWGAFAGITFVRRVTDNFALAALVGAVVGALMGVFMQRFFLSRFYKNDLALVLLTFGFLFMFQDLGNWLVPDLAKTPTVPPAPALLNGAVRLGTFAYPAYRLFMILVGVLVAIGLWVVVERTKVGAVIRAGVDDEEMLRGTGVNVALLFTAVFALGAALAGFAGVVGTPFYGLHPGADLDVLLLAFVVLIVGGLGSLKGAFLGSLFVGLVDTFGRALFPELSQFTIFAPMALMLAIRPTGMFGRV